jgi:serine/threonine protein kinase
LFWELAQAVHYLHCKDIVHRDLKLDNVLVTEDDQGLTVKLADFGFATKLDPNQPLVSSYKGTKRGYMAPEIHSCKNDSNLKYDAKATDIFALGVILYAMVMGRLPF